MRQPKDFTEFSVDFISLTVEFPMSSELFVRPFDLLVARLITWLFDSFNISPMDENQFEIITRDLSISANSLSFLISQYKVVSSAYTCYENLVEPIISFNGVR